MGCDIHVHTEIKVKGKWLHYSQPRLKADYELFGWLAGVRREDNQLFKVKGFPKDANEITNLYYKELGVDAHTPSYIGAKEIANLFEHYETENGSKNSFNWEHETVGYLFGNGWGTFDRYKSDYPNFIEDIRWVFWFDN